MSIHTVSCELAGKTLTLETGRLARQADGAVYVSYGNTRVLVTVCSSKKPKEGIDFFPLTVEYQPRYYAAGKFPGGFFKRETRPGEEAVLSARLIDRPIRPLFPEGFRCETQVVATVLSLDHDSDPDIAAAIGASAALHISDIPFRGPTAGMRMGRKNSSWILAPSLKEEDLELDIFVAGTSQAIMMVEGGAKEVSEDIVLEGILKAHEEIKKLCALVEELRQKAGTEKRVVPLFEIDAKILEEVQQKAKSQLAEAFKTKDKSARYEKIAQAESTTLAAIAPEPKEFSDFAPAAQRKIQTKAALEDLKYRLMREMILKTKSRIDGRSLTEIRPIRTETSLLPNAHGSALFTRGETQVLAVVTLGSKDDEQIVDTPQSSHMKKFMLHYNFPPYSVGEVGRFSGQSRREVGHGNLAERSVSALAPKFSDFPYTIRTVCETLESNGSSSMGSVCSASMALMDAGVPYTKPIAGIAMGLIKENNDIAILSDILGDEDHLGDMDFKVAGTRDGITGIQMDIKIEGVNGSILQTALQQAKEGRLHILNEMSHSISASRAELNSKAPRIQSMTVPTDKIAAIIGPGGKVIKEITAQTGAKIDINDLGQVNIFAADQIAGDKAYQWIRSIIEEPEMDKVYLGTVKKIVEFGAFVSILPNHEGLLHISEIAHERVAVVGDYLKEGEKVEVKVIGADPKTGKIRLSRKVLLTPPQKPSKN